MKAADVIKAYKNGERNFQRLNLRGANFKGQDLSGADFSYCQLQSANFSQANLTNTNFIGAKAGLQKRWVIILLLVLWLISALSGFFSFFTAALIRLLIIEEKSNLAINFAGWMTIFLMIVLFILVIRYGFGKTVAIGFSFSVAGAIIFVIGGTVEVAGAFAYAFIALFAFAFAATITFSIVTAISITISGVFPAIIAGILTVIFSGLSTLSILFSITFILLGGYLGWKSHAEYSKDKWIRQAAIAFAAMGGTSFYSATITDADFTGATLKNVNFNRAILTRTCFKDTVKLNLARPGNTLLEKPIVRDLLINPSSGEGKDLTEADLRGAYLKEANLQRANLKNADISEATFEYANLSHANLTEVNAVYTNFNSAYLTGACLENWNIDYTTILNNIDCQYIFLLENLNEHGSQERRPSSGDFQEGEFTELFKEVFDTVDLIFRNGIDWKAFIETIKTVQVENEDTPLEVSSIENKGDGVFVVKVKVPPDANKEKIHQEFEANYQLKLQAVENNYKRLLAEKDIENKDEIIKLNREHNANMMEITTILAKQSGNKMTDKSTNFHIEKIESSGNLNIGKNLEDVNKTINQISENNNKQNEQLKNLLQELMQAIETENELDEDEKAEAANKVKTIIKASQNPEDQGLQKKATRAVKLLETLAKGLEPATKLYTAFQSILPQVFTFLGITI